MATHPAVEPLFRPFTVKTLSLRNRIVMAPMTRSFSPRGVPGPNVAAYYQRRAENGVGLIVTEGTVVPHPSSSGYPDVPRLFGSESLNGWAGVVSAVHDAGGRIVPQLWHVGTVRKPGWAPSPDVPRVGPSGLAGPGEAVGEPMTLDDIEAVISAFG